MKNDPKDDFRKDDFSAIGSSDGSFSPRSRAAASRLRNQSRSRLSRIEIRASAHACDGAVGAHGKLRAAKGLARLWREAGRVDEARALLAPVLGSFTEGLDTRDLLEGKAILDELA